MAATRTGAHQYFSNLGAVSSGSVTGIPVPADAELVLASFSGYSSTPGLFGSGTVTFTKGGTDTTMDQVHMGAASPSSDNG